MITTDKAKSHLLTILWHLNFYTVFVTQFSIVIVLDKIGQNSRKVQMFLIENSEDIVEDQDEFAEVESVNSEHLTTNGESNKNKVADGESLLNSDDRDK